MSHSVKTPADLNDGGVLGFLPRFFQEPIE